MPDAQSHAEIALRKSPPQFHTAIHEQLAPAAYRPTPFAQPCTAPPIERLRNIYPAVVQTLGLRRFNDMSLRFAARHSARKLSLEKFGAGYSIFLVDQPVARTMPYLPDLARLEWAIHLTRRAPDRTALPATALDRFRAGKYRRIALELHPSCHLVRSRFPVVDLYRAALPEADPTEAVASEPDGTRLLIQRLTTRIAFRSLPPDEFRFLAALRAGRTVNVARPHPAFEVHGAIARLAASGALVGYAIQTSASA